MLRRCRVGYGVGGWWNGGGEGKKSLFFFSLFYSFNFLLFFSPGLKIKYKIIKRGRKRRKSE